MDVLDVLAQEQLLAEEQHREFLQNLDPSRTVTLRGLIECQNNLAPHTLQTPWLQTNLLNQALRAMIAFFQSIAASPTIRGFRNTPLFFLQASPLEEDKQEIYRRFERRDALRKKYRSISPTVLYLHTGGGFNPRLTGIAGSKNRHIPPLSRFSNRKNEDYTQSVNSQKKPIIGYRIPDYSDLLQVNSNVATLYLARLICHDLGHFFLPKLTDAFDDDREELHNAVMLHAMNIDIRDVKCNNIWEEMISQECTNPLFFLERKKFFALCNKERLSPTQKHILKCYRDLYTQAQKYRNQIWGFTPRMRTLRAKAKQIYTILNEMERDGFTRYYLPWEKISQKK